jgi:CDP-diacylglycerol--glycerol-3-phosphate 3-phosphatidyltransferase
MPITIPNLLTWLRIALIPVFIVVFYLPYPWAPPASALVFALAGITDWLDGYLARRLGQGSSFGAFLDPVADKLIVVAALVLLVQYDGRILLAIPAVVIIGREIAISALREWMAEIGSSRSVAVSWLGKVKTVAQITALIMLLWRHPIGPLPVYEVGMVLIYLAAALTLISMFYYVRAAWPAMRRQD